MKQEYPTYLKTIGKSKALAAILSDTKPEDDSDNEDDGILNAFTTIVNPPEGIVEDVDEEEELVESKFEKIKMEEDESFDEFCAKLKDIVNSTFNLGEFIPEPKIVRNVLRSLPERFHAKITVIEDLKDIDKIP